MSKFKRLGERLNSFLDNHFGIVYITICCLIIGVPCYMIHCQDVRHNTRIAAAEAACACSVVPGDDVTLISSGLTATIVSRLPLVNNCPAYSIVIHKIPYVTADVLGSDIQECVRGEK